MCQESWCACHRSSIQKIICRKAHEVPNCYRGRGAWKDIPLPIHLNQHSKNTRWTDWTATARFIDQFGGDPKNSILLSFMSASRFASSPTGTANFFLKCCTVLGSNTSNAKLIEDMISAFVNVICPPEEKDTSVPSENIGSFALGAILYLLSSDIGSKCSNARDLTQCVLRIYIWLSCPRHLSLDIHIPGRAVNPKARCFFWVLPQTWWAPAKHLDGGSSRMFLLMQQKSYSCTTARLLLCHSWIS